MCMISQAKLQPLMPSFPVQGHQDWCEPHPLHVFLVFLHVAPSYNTGFRHRLVKNPYCWAPLPFESSPSASCNEAMLSFSPVDAVHVKALAYVERRDTMSYSLRFGAPTAARAQRHNACPSRTQSLPRGDWFGLGGGGTFPAPRT